MNDKANLKACFTCQSSLDKQDFVFSFDKMKTAKRARTLVVLPGGWCQALRGSDHGSNARRHETVLA